MEDFAHNKRSLYCKYCACGPKFAGTGKTWLLVRYYNREENSILSVGCVLFFRYIKKCILIQNNADLNTGFAWYNKRKALNGRVPVESSQRERARG